MFTWSAEAGKAAVQRPKAELERPLRHRAGERNHTIEKSPMISSAMSDATKLLSCKSSQLRA